MNWDKNIWLGLGFMSAHKVMQFKWTGRYQSKKLSLLFNFSAQECGGLARWILQLPTLPDKDFLVWFQVATVPTEKQEH